MRSLFEIDNDIINCIDPETGEVNEDDLNALQQERDEKIEGVICAYKNTLAYAEALKVQEKLFEERRKREEKRAESLKAYIAKALDGNKFSTAKVEVGFRRSKSVVFAEDFTNWALNNDRDDLLVYSEPKPSKTAIKKALESGEDVPAEIVESLNISIK